MKKTIIPFILLILLSFLYGEDNFISSDNIDYAQVVGATAQKNYGDTWTISVTVKHNDQGWEHYADKWIVVNPLTKEILAERVLTHPHDTEQPFTRSLSGINIPSELTYVEIWAKCNLHGYKGKRFILELKK